LATIKAGRGRCAHLYQVAGNIFGSHTAGDAP